MNHKMIVLLDTAHDLNQCAADLGAPVEQLLTPLTRYRPQQPEQRFAIDNGAFSKFEEASFLSLLERERPRRDLCRFVAVPDVVCDARRTLEVFDRWAPRLEGWPIALVLQNGQETLPIPWERISAIFIGGDTAWKIGPHAIACMKAAKALKKWIHVGRVNSPARFEWAERMGADSIDGTGLARYTHMRDKIAASARIEMLPGIT